MHVSSRDDKLDNLYPVGNLRLSYQPISEGNVLVYVDTMVEGIRYNLYTIVLYAKDIHEFITNYTTDLLKTSEG